eukprot:g14217.t1
MNEVEDSVWTSLEPSNSLPDSKPAGRCGHVAVSSRDGKSLIVIGGYNSGGILSDTWEFHLERREWDHINLAPGASPPERAYFRGCGGPPLNGADEQHPEEGEKGVFAYIFGGSDAEGNASDELWCMDVDNRTWHAMPRDQGPRPSARSNHTMCRAGQFLAVHGGESASGSLLDDLWFFHPASASWREGGDQFLSPSAGPRPCRRSSHCLAFAQTRSMEGSAGIPGRLVLFGGLGHADADGGGDRTDRQEVGEELETMPLNDLWVFTPSSGAGPHGQGPGSGGGGWSLVMLDGVGPSPRSLAAVVSPRRPCGGGSEDADLFLFGGYGLVEIPAGGGEVVDDGAEQEEEEEGVEIIMAYIDDLWRLNFGRGEGGSSSLGADTANERNAALDPEWADEADMGFPGESIVEGRNGHTLTWCDDKLVLFGGFVGDGFDAGIHATSSPDRLLSRMAPPRRSLSSPPAEHSGSGGTSSSSSTAAMLLLMMGYVFALSEKLQSELKKVYNSGSSGGSSSSSSSSSSQGRSDAPPASSALEPTRQRHGEQDLHAPDHKGEGPQQEPKQRHRASNRLEFLVAALRKFWKFSSPSSHSTVSSARMTRGRKQEQQQQGQAPPFAALFSGPGDSLPTAAGAAARKGSGATGWARKVRLGSSGIRSAPTMTMQQQKGRGLLPTAASTKRSRQTDKTLCLDLDETLVHARGDAREMGENRFDFMLFLPQHRQQQHHQGQGQKTVAGAGRQQQCSAVGGEKWRGSGGKAGAEKDADGISFRRIFVRKRPHLKEFLEAASQMFEVVLFTAAPEEFAQAVVERIDPERRLVDHVLSRESCTRVEIDGSSSNSACGGGTGKGKGRRRSREGGPTSVVKDLEVVGRPLSKVIMVENSLDAIRYHLENGVHISSFYGDREDTELLSTLKALKTLAPMADVRDGIIRSIPVKSSDDSSYKDGKGFREIEDVQTGNRLSKMKFKRGGVAETRRIEEAKNEHEEEEEEGQEDQEDQEEEHKEGEEGEGDERHGDGSEKAREKIGRQRIVRPHRSFLVGTGAAAAGTPVVTKSGENSPGQANRVVATSTGNKLLRVEAPQAAASTSKKQSVGQAISTPATAVMKKNEYALRLQLRSGSKKGLAAATGATAGYLSMEATLVICVLGIYSCYLSAGMLQEAISSYRSPDGGRFSATMFLLWVPCVVNAIFAFGVMHFNGRSSEKMPQHLFGTAGFGYTGAMVFSTEALKYVNFPTKVLGKSCKMIPVMLFGVLFAKKRYKLRDYMCVGLITAGIVTFNLSKVSHNAQKDTESSGYGRFLLLLSLLLDGVTTSAQERLKAVCKPTVHEMMFFMNTWALGFLSVGSFFTGQWMDGVIFLSENPLVACYVLGLSLASTAGQNFVYFTITSFNPLVCTTISTTRKFFTIVFSVLFFGHPIEASQWGGVAMVFAGIGLEIKGKYERHAEKSAQKLENLKGLHQV